MQRFFRRAIVVAISLTVCVGTSGLAAAGDEALIVSRILAVPSGELHNGKLVWVDLITTEPKKAANFYATVFDWQPLLFPDENYIELSHDGRVMSSIVFYEDDRTVEGDARWLVSISVRDVDAATRVAAENGGEIFEPATDLPDRGRYSVVGDAQGAILMLLRATGGDPAEAVRFYQAIAGYDAGGAVLVQSGGAAAVAIVMDPTGGGYPDIPDIPEGPGAALMPDFGMPDAGMMDMGGFDFRSEG